MKNQEFLYCLDLMAFIVLKLAQVELRVGLIRQRLVVALGMPYEHLVEQMVVILEILVVAKIVLHVPIRFTGTAAPAGTAPPRPRR